MPIEFRCPHCGQLLAVPDEAAGSTGTCRFCGATIVAPAGVDQPAQLLQPGTQPVAPYAAPAPGQPTGQVEPGAIVSEAWRILLDQWLIVLGSYLIIIVITMIVMAPFLVPVIIASAKDPGSAGLSIPAVLGMSLIGVLLAPLTAGPLYVVDRLLARGESNIGSVFLGLRHYPQLAVYGFLMSIPGTIISLIQAGVQQVSPEAGSLVSILAAVVGFVVFVVLQVGQMEIVDRNAEPMDALRTSFEATRGRLGMIFVSWILIVLCVLAGYIACCVGVFFTIGFVPVGQVLIYRQLRGLQGGVD